jgi:hypothetical protein
VCCSYCGKEIGAFRLLRDREFCSALHRAKYGERLGKALVKLASPEPAPAGIAGFRVQMPFQQGNLIRTLILRQTVSGRNRIRTGAHWPLAIDIGDDTIDTASVTASVTTSDLAPVPECAPAECPPRSERWMPAPTADPVAAFVQTSAALAPAYTVRALRFAAELEPTAVLDKARYAPAACDHWMPAPTADPVAAFVQTSAALAPAFTVRALRFAAELEPTAALDKARYAPPACDHWMPAPTADPVARFVQASAALAPAYTLRLPRFAAEAEPTPCVDLALDTPPACERWMAGPTPEPVARFVQTSAALAPAHILCIPRFAAELEPAPMLHQPMFARIPTPEPVAAFVLASAALVPAHILCIPRFAAEREAAPMLNQPMFARVPTPEPVAAFVQTSAALNPAHAPHTLRFAAELAPPPLLHGSPAACSLWMPDRAQAAYGTPAQLPAQLSAELSAELSAQSPAPQLTADLPIPSRPLSPPAAFQQWMPSPAAAPVFHHLQPSTDPAVAVPATIALSVAAPYVPWIAQSQSMPHAEPVMVAVRPNVANLPLVQIGQEAVLSLPAIPQIAQEPFAAARPASTPAPEAAERLLVAARAAVAVSTECAPCRSQELVAPPVVFEPAPAMGKPVASPAPAALERLLVAAVAAPMAAAVRMPPFAVAASRPRTVALFDAQRLAPLACQPDAAAPRLVAPQPIATLAVATPSHARLLLESALPHPGLLPIEFHSHRGHSVPAARPEWAFPRPALLPPRFLLRPVLEKLEESTTRQRTAPKEPGVVKILNMPAPKRPPTVLMVASRIAAGFLLAASLWYGVANLRGDRHLAAREEVSSGDAALSANSASSARMPNGERPAPPAPKGPVAWVRKTIANRAALKLAENFHGMENWESAAKAHPAGWARHPDGYMNTGALALFRPTLKFTDYRMEFFGQIESKSIGWTVRAADARNYHAMKLTVVEAGLRPFVALVQYNVVDGISGRRTQTPLNVMVHNRTPMQFTVDVRGNRFVTSIDGEEVDSFTDSTLVAGGVGFFSEAGERARLYWMRVSRNDDWLGHVCGMLAGEAGEGSVAGLQPPELPGGSPAPGLPGGVDSVTLGAVWLGLPYSGATRKTRFFKTRFFKTRFCEPRFCKPRRSELWNT